MLLLVINWRFLSHGNPCGGKLGTWFASEQETDEETTKEERIQQKMMDLTRRKNEPGRYLKDLRNKPKVSMVRVSRADAIEEIENENHDSKKQE